MTKVYCSECKHLVVDGNNKYTCMAPDNLIVTRCDWLMKSTVPDKKPRVLNKDNDCYRFSLGLEY